MKVVLYVMDALRRDFVGCYGQEADTTPRIDAFAEDAVRYESAYSTATWTKAAATSILTSRHPRALDMMRHMDALPDVEYSLPRFLSAAGFETGAVSANNFVAEEFGFTGFDDFRLLQADPEYQEGRSEAKDPQPHEERMLETLGIDRIVTPLSEDVNAAAFDFLDGAGDDAFLLAWSMDTHGPYFVRGEESAFGNSTERVIREDEVSPENVDEVRSVYRDMIRYNDETFGRLLDRLRDDGEYEDALVILAADHGESFGDHTSVLDVPIFGHNGPVYEEVVRVPLLVKFPGNDRGGRTVDGLSQLIDVLPTIADVIGETAPDEAEGVSLRPPIDGGLDGRTLFLESQSHRHAPYSGAVRRGDHKLLKIEKRWRPTTDVRKLAETALWKYTVPSTQLFDLAADPGEERNVAGERPDAAAELSAAFEERRDRLAAAAKATEGRRLEDVTADTERRLKALGYLE